jgi:hypothetical protein
MPVHLQASTAPHVIEVRVSGQLRREDYEQFTPHVDSLIEQRGKIRIYLELQDFAGWDAGALWADIKFSAKHFNDIERLAVVGEKQWESGITVFCKPFTTAEIRYFEPRYQEAARSWIINRDE